MLSDKKNPSFPFFVMERRRDRLFWFVSVVWCSVAIQVIGIWSTLQHLLENSLLSIPFNPFNPQSSNDVTTDTADEVALVTGSNRGLGLATAELLVRRGVHTFFLCRSRPAAVTAVNRLFREPSLRARCTIIECDLASFGSVRKAVSDVVLALMRMSTRLDYIVLNAGVMNDLPTFQAGEDGYELQLKVNTLSHALLVHLLLKAGVVRSSPDSRIVSVSSFAHHGFTYLDDHTRDPLTMDPSAYHAKLAYARSKWYQILLMQELRTSMQRTYGIQAVPCVSVNPGVVDTDMARNYCKGEFPNAVRWLSDPILDMLMTWALRRPKTAAALVLAVLMADAGVVDGRYVYMGPTGTIRGRTYPGYAGRLTWPDLIARIDV